MAAMDVNLSISDLFVALLMGLGALQAVFIGLIFLLRSTGNKKANLFFGGLLLAFALAIVNLIFAHMGIYSQHQYLYFIPLWYTLSFGPFLFYYVKFSLYPTYELRRSDAKHFLLPIAQALFYWSIGFRDEAFKDWIWEVFIRPFFSTFEGILFLISFFGYLALSYRYIKFKQAILKKKDARPWELRKVTWLQNVVKVLFVLACINSFYTIVDFVAFRFFQRNLYNLPGFSYLGDLSFAAMVYWLGFNGYKNEFFAAYHRSESKAARREYRPFDSAELQRWQEKLLQQFEKERRYLDPELKLEHLARALELPPKTTSYIINEGFGKSFNDLLNEYRVEEVKKRLTDPRFQHYSLLSIGYDAGFNSKATFYRAFKKATGQTPREYREGEGV